LTSACGETYDWPPRPDGGGVADTIRAIAMIRERAAEYAIDPDKLVAIGFSAGAHAVAHAAMNADVKARPNYVAPIYGGPFGGIPQFPRLIRRRSCRRCS
jgi:dienelactone hydrolase